MLCSFSTWGSAQSLSLKFEHLTIEDGLSANGAWNIIQDSKGYMWFGTFSGLNKYDGYSITSYQFRPHDTTSIAQNQIFSLYEDKEGFIWIGTIEGGICKFDRNTEKFTTYKPASDHPYIPALRSVCAIGEDREGRIWAGTFDGELRMLNKQTGKFSQPYDLGYTSEGDVDKFDQVLSIYQDRTGTLWVGNETGLHMLTFTEEKNGQVSQVRFINYRHDPKNEHSLSNNKVSSIYEDKKGMLWIGTYDGGLNRFDRKKGTFTRYLHNTSNPLSLSHNSIFVKCITEDKRGNLWIGTANGLNRLDTSRREFTRYYHNAADPNSLSNNAIAGLFTDKAGNVWVATVGGGINKLDAYQQPFTLYQHPAYQQGLSDNSVTAIYEDRTGKMWIGTRKGLHQLDKKKGTFIPYLGDSTYSKDAIASMAMGVPNTQVEAILQDHFDTLWVVAGDEISRIYPKTGKWIPSSGNTVLDNSLKGSYRVTTLFEDSQEVLWVGTNGIRSFNRKTNEVKQYIHHPQNPDGLSDYFAVDIQEDREGNLWIGHGSIATSKFNRKTGRFIRYSHNPLDTNSISSNNIIVIFLDSKGTIWLGTVGGGLCRYNNWNDTFTTYGEKQGLAVGTVKAILEDEGGNLWLSTDKGISKFSPATGLFTNYDGRDGLQNNQFFPRSGFKGKDGTFYFGGFNGLSAFKPDQLQDNPYVPPVVITGFKLFDKLLAGKHEKEEIVLNYNENFISFQFAALNYTNSQKNQYTYQLEGVDRSWVNAATTRMATYTDISPGVYTFRVKGSNNDGVWNEQAASIRIIILPPFWHATWAYLIYGLLFISGLILARKAIINRERLQADLRVQQVESEKLREINQMKSRFFTNVSHEFRTPLSIIKGIVQKWNNQGTENEVQKTEFGMISRNTDRLLQLINQLLDLSRLEAAQLTPHLQAVDISGLLRAVAGSFESLAQSKGLTYHYGLPLKPLWSLADADKLEKILTNLLANAIKFTPSGGQVVLTASVEDITSGNCRLRLLIQDTGIGIKAEHLPYIFNRFYQADPTSIRSYEGTGIGLALSKELTELLGGTIEVESKPGQGTCFTVHLPLQAASPPQRDISIQNEATEKYVQETLSTDKEQENSLSQQVIQLQHNNKHKSLVLVIEDNADLSAFIKESLSAQYNVVEAKDGHEGLSKALASIPDLIISDVMMPGMDGFTLCQELKTDDRTSHIPLILLTAKTDISSKLSGLNKGADDYLTKPFALSELEARIKNLITGRRKLRQLFSRQLTLQTGEVTVISTEDRFLQKALSIVEANLSNADFDVEAFSREMGMSISQLRRKLTALTEQAPTDFIRLLRLQRAAVLLRGGQGNISEVAMMVGFNSLNYFTRCFKEQFAKTPSEFLREVNDSKV